MRRVLLQAPCLIAAGFMLASCSGLSRSTGSPQMLPASSGAASRDVEFERAKAAGPARGSIFTFKHVRGSIIPALMNVNGNEWLTATSLNASNLPIEPSYLGLVESPTQVRSYAYHGIDIDGRRVTALPLFAVVAPPSLGSNSIVFNWSTPNQTEAGLAVVDAAHPRTPVFYAGGQAGDPLYSPSLTQPFSDPLYAGSAMLWSNQAASTNPVWGLATPFSSPPAYINPAIGPASDPTYGTIGNDDRYWFPLTASSPPSTSLVALDSSGGITSFPVTLNGGLYAFFSVLATADGLLSVVYVQGPTCMNFGIAKFNYSGALQSQYCSPLGFSPLILGTSADSEWALAEDPGSHVALLRLRNDGAWSWFSSGQPIGAHPVASAVDAKGSPIYFGFSNALRDPRLVTFNPSNLIVANPFAATLQANQSVQVAVSEANYSGGFTAAVLDENTASPQLPCNLSVAGSGSNFTVTASASVPSGCFVTFTDSKGLATAVTAVSS